MYIPFPGGSEAKASPAMQETWVRPLGGEDPLEKEMSTHSTIVAWKIPWIEEPSGLQSMGSQRVDLTEQLNKNNNNHFLRLHCGFFVWFGLFYFWM